MLDRFTGSPSSPDLGAASQDSAKTRVICVANIRLPILRGTIVFACVDQKKGFLRCQPVAPLLKKQSTARALLLSGGIRCRC